MVSTLKERPNGGFYCSECRMSTAEPVEVCPFCGSIISNWMDLIISQENDRVRATLDINPETGQNKYATGGLISYDKIPDIIIGGRWYETPVEEIGPPLINEEDWNKIVSMIRRKNE